MAEATTSGPTVGAAGTAGGGDPRPGAAPAVPPDDGAARLAAVPLPGEKPRARTDAERKAAQRERETARKRTEAMAADLEDGLRDLFVVLAMALHEALLRENDPRFPPESAQYLAKKWAPIVARYVDDVAEVEQWVPLILALAATVRVGVDYYATVKAHRAELEQPSPAAPRDVSTREAAA